MHELVYATVSEKVVVFRITVHIPPFRASATLTFGASYDCHPTIVWRPRWDIVSISPRIVGLRHVSQLHVMSWDCVAEQNFNTDN